LIALIITVLTFVINIFTPKQAALVESLTANLVRVIENGTIEDSVSHPLEDKRVVHMDN